ncbi:MAG: hypothetical protein CYPHOPRED_002556, partial [Cyphobasidiales sp. Tagirdzhanova-0007]
MENKFTPSIDSRASYYQVPLQNESASLAGSHTYPASAGFAAGKGASRSLARPWYRSPWVLYGAPAVLLAIIAAAVVGGIEGSKSSKNSGSSSGKGINNDAAGSNAIISTDINGNPVYATSTIAAPAAPTTSASSASSSCGPDTPTWNNQSSDTYHVRTDHPKLFATQNRWNCLPSMISQDSYLRSWNDTIMANATMYYNDGPVQYNIDGGLSGSGVLDIARELQLRTKHWAYAYRMTNDTKWVNRTWSELLIASGNSSESFGNSGNNWNTQHFLDVAEFTLAFAYSYDWMYDAWSHDQRNAIMWSIINLGLQYGLGSYTNPTDHADYGWWQTTNGNWN